MRIETSIKPRKDGTVSVAVDAMKYTFAPDEPGTLVAEVENEAHIAFLLARGDDFLPADDADFDKADALVSGAAKQDEGDGDDEDDDEPKTVDAAPIEEPASVIAADAPVRAGRKNKHA